MTDNELLLSMSDMLDKKLKPIEDRIMTIEDDTKGLKRQLIKSTAELKAMDDIIFCEVERVHEILDKHTNDTKKHTA